MKQDPVKTLKIPEYVHMYIRVGAITLRPPKRDHDFQHSHFNELL